MCESRRRYIVDPKIARKQIKKNLDNLMDLLDTPIEKFNEGPEVIGAPLIPRPSDVAFDIIDRGRGLAPIVDGPIEFVNKAGHFLTGWPPLVHPPIKTANRIIITLSSADEEYDEEIYSEKEDKEVTDEVDDLLQDQN
jgi:hypothetical protein